MTVQVKEIVPQILRFDSLPSTNLEAARRAVEGSPEGLCVVAAEQTAGRGRLQREWVSPKGAGIYVSIILRPSIEQKFWPLVTLMAAVAVHDVLNDTCRLRTDIKWPNDVLFDEKKLCGILAETVETSNGRSVILGIGINLNDDSFPADLEQVATSIQSSTGEVPDSELLLANLLNVIVSGYHKLHLVNGPKWLVDNYCARSSYCAGKRVRVTDDASNFIGTTGGLEPDGALRIELEDGTVRVVRSADVERLRVTES